jgi:hypothetical protein
LADEGSQGGLGESIKRQRRKQVAGGLVTMSQQPGIIGRATQRMTGASLYMRRRRALAS